VRPMVIIVRCSPSAGAPRCGECRGRRGPGPRPHRALAAPRRWARAPAAERLACLLNAAHAPTRAAIRGASQPFTPQRHSQPVALVTSQPRAVEARPMRLTLYTRTIALTCTNAPQHRRVSRPIPRRPRGPRQGCGRRGWLECGGQLVRARQAQRRDQTQAWLLPSRTAQVDCQRIPAGSPPALSQRYQGPRRD
jgi:hypothetical protein